MSIHSKSPHVWVTRPWEQAQPLKAPLEQAGFSVTFDPLLRYVPLEAPVAWPSKIRALLVTSSYALECLVRQKLDFSIPLWVVGERSTQHAWNLGFHHAVYGGMNQKELVQNLVRQIRPEEGELVYASGKTVYGALHKTLAYQGYAIQRVIVYRTEPVSTFRPETWTLLQQRALDGVVFFSQETSRIFFKNMSSCEWNACETLDVFALSARILAPLSGLAFRSCHWSSKPAWACLFQLLRSHYYDNALP